MARARVPPGRRQARDREPDGRQGVGPEPDGGRGRALLHRVQLHAPPGQRLPVALRARGLRDAGGRLRPVGQHHPGHRPHPPHAGPAGVRADLAPAHQERRHQVRQDRPTVRSGSTRPRPARTSSASSGCRPTTPRWSATSSSSPSGPSTRSGRSWRSTSRRPSGASPSARWPGTSPRSSTAPEAAEAAEAAADLLFGGDPTTASLEAFEAVRAEVPASPGRLDQLDDVVALLVSTGLASSNSDARRTLGPARDHRQRAPARRGRGPGAGGAAPRPVPAAAQGQDHVPPGGFSPWLS